MCSVQNLVELMQLFRQYESLNLAVRLENAYSRPKQMVIWDFDCVNSINATPPPKKNILACKRLRHCVADRTQLDGGVVSCRAVWIGYKDERFMSVVVVVVVVVVGLCVFVDTRRGVVIIDDDVTCVVRDGDKAQTSVPCPQRHSLSVCLSVCLSPMDSIKRSINLQFQHCTRRSGPVDLTILDF